MIKYLLALLALGATLGGCRSNPAASEPEPSPVLAVEIAKVTSRDIHELLPIDGSFTLAPGDFARLAPVAPGKIQRVLVKEGDHVKAGQLLATIDMTVLNAQKASASANAAAAQATARQAASALSAARFDFSAAVTTAELNLQAVIAERDANIEQAQLELSKLKAGARPQEVSQAEQAVRQAQVTRDKALADAERDRKLFAEGYVSGQQADASEAAFQVAESALAQAKDQLQIVKLGARIEDIRAAESRLRSARTLGEKRVAAAKASRDQARNQRSSLDAKTSETQAAQMDAAAKRSENVAAAGLAANGEIRAPFAGIVSRRLLSPGDSTDGSNPVLEIARAGAHVEFSGFLSPKSASAVSPGMRVVSLKAGLLSGTIRSVGVPDATSGQVPIKIVLTGSSASVPSGSFERLQIVLRTLSDVLVVPTVAVITREDKVVVFVVAGDTAKLREVEVGPSEGGFIAILKGLTRSDTIILVGQHELSDGAKITQVKSEAGK